MCLGSALVEDGVQFGVADELAVTLLDRFQRRNDGIGHVFLEGAVALASVGRFDLFVGLVGQGREDFNEVGNARLVLLIVVDGIFTVRLGPLDFLFDGFRFVQR